MTGVEARNLILAGEAPDGLQVRGRLDLTNTGTIDLPCGLRCYHLELRGSGIRALPEGLEVEYKLDLQDCRGLEELPEGLDKAMTKYNRAGGPEDKDAKDNG